MSPPIIETRNLTKYFGRGMKTVKAVDGIDIKVAGGIHGFLGPNGAGKSTAIKMLVGALRCTSGNAYIKGHPAGSVAANKLIGYLPEHPKFYNMTLIDYLLYMGQLGGLSRSKAKSNAYELVSWLGLSDAVDRNVNDFSAGMKQKVGLAQAMIHEPELLILDEPTANLDAIGRADIIEKIKKLVSEKNITVFVSSHILSEIEKMVDAVTIINKGKIVIADDINRIKGHFVGNHYVLKVSKPNELYEILRAKEFVNRIWLDENNELQIISERDEDLKRALPQILVASSATLDSFKKLDITLENIFLRLVGVRKEGGGY